MDWHNPDNLPHPGNGYRFLLKSEIRDYRRHEFTDLWTGTRWETGGYQRGWYTTNSSCTLRTKLTIEEYAAIQSQRS